MSPAFGQNLQIRTMIYIAGEPVPLFWPMRSFIHHNPLHGLESLPFPQAIERGKQLFGAKGFLTRPQYQSYLVKGQIDQSALDESIHGFVMRHPVHGLPLAAWLTALLTRMPGVVAPKLWWATVGDIQAVLSGNSPQGKLNIAAPELADMLAGMLFGDRPRYEAVDTLYGTGIESDVDEQVIKACLDFFDEGQSAWSMPDRERGFFKSWIGVAGRDFHAQLQSLMSGCTSPDACEPEDVIAAVMRAMGIPEDRWVGYFTRELSHLHGWAGFIRWRSNASHYYWQRQYPGDLVDLIAVRLLVAHTLLSRRLDRRYRGQIGDLETYIAEHPREAYLRSEYHGGCALPGMAHRIAAVLDRGRAAEIEQCFDDYVDKKRCFEADRQAELLRSLADAAGDSDVLRSMTADTLESLIGALRAFEHEEGMTWLEAMESKAISGLLGGLELSQPAPREKRPFVQALFCIDTRSERIRRHLEAVGDYQTFGIAGFFGVPVSFMELGKGSENHLCPVLLTPRNLVLEITAAGPQDVAALSALEKAMHELKESVLTPFVMVEAIGLLFGFDMIGKTLAPDIYNRWRKRMHGTKPPTHLLLDKLSREQADSIVRAVQRAVIVKAVEQEFGLTPDGVTDSMIREVRESAMGHEQRAPELVAALGLSLVAEQAFIERLRTAFRINPSFAQLQLERLGRIGFSLDEQVRFVSQALRSIGMTKHMSRFVLLVGHGSTSENNPYESALDCGACGGSHGLVSARVLSQMANKPEVRRRLLKQGIEVAEDVWFVPALHNTTTDEINLFDLELLPPSHLIYLDRLRDGLTAASRRCAQERLPSLSDEAASPDPITAARGARRNAMDWSQVRPEWGLSRNAYFIIGRRQLTQSTGLDGRAFLHSYDYQLDPKLRLLENILTGPLVVGQWINMEHYFSTVDNDKFGSGSKIYHNVAGRLGVMTGNLSDLRTGLPSQTVLRDGSPYHEPMRLITLIEAPFDKATQAVESVVSVKRLVRNGWIRLLILDPLTGMVHFFKNGEWQSGRHANAVSNAASGELPLS